MKKMIKLSLVAAVAVAGLTTSATAGSLENAIKDTTISGKALIGYNYADNGMTNTTSNTNEYDIDLTLTTKVNDTISFTTGVEADHDIAVDANSTDMGKGNEIGLTKLYFTAKTDVATVMVGKQKQPTPFMDDERGDGVVALVPAGPVTIAAGHFTGMNNGVTGDITAAAVIGTFGPVNASLWYANATGVIDSAYSVNLTTKVGPVSLDIMHSEVEMEGTNASDASLTKLIASGKVADINLVAGYGFTNDDVNTNRSGTDAAAQGVDITGDSDAKTNFRLDQIKLDNYNDANAILLGASMTFGQTTVGANYLMATAKNYVGTTDLDATELDLTVKYAMSKNFSITGLYADTDADLAGTDAVDTKHMELSLNYKF